MFVYCRTTKEKQPMADNVTRYKGTVENVAINIGEKLLQTLKIEEYESWHKKNVARGLIKLERLAVNNEQDARRFGILERFVWHEYDLFKDSMGSDKACKLVYLKLLYHRSLFEAGMPFSVVRKSYQESANVMLQHYEGKLNIVEITEGDNR